MNACFARSLTLAALLGANQLASAETVWLDELDIAKTEQQWGAPGKNRSVDGQPLTIAGRVFARGLGTHAESLLGFNLDGHADRFIAFVGVDDEVTQPGSVEFRVVGDGKTLWESGVMKSGQPAKPVEVALKDVRRLLLVVGDAGDGINYDHADWADAKFEFSGAKPIAAEPPKEAPYILTPKPSPKPRINGARVVGCRPGRPFLFTIPATGDRPMTFSAKGLPAGLHLDAATGIITGAVPARGDYVVTLRAKNPRGRAERRLTIRCGDTLALTPPMGWNSWNCFAHAVSAEKVQAAADAMLQSGLVNHGWTYINIDDFWEKHPGSQDPTLGGPGRDAEGRMVPNPRFPDLKALCDYVHARGLKIGIYSSPGPTTCGGCLGSFDHELLDAQSYAAWGIDYLKYDWCSYNPDQEQRRTRPLDCGLWTNAWKGAEFAKRESLMLPYARMRAALDAVNRDIVYSLCQYGMGNVWEWNARVGGNCCRTTGDIVDSWGSMAGIGFAQAGHERFVSPGHWNDPDMLVVGKVGWGPSLHPTRLSPNEQYTHITLWCLLAAPLLIGCDMTQLDDFTLSLLTNDEVIEVNQDPLGRQAARVAKEGPLEVWAKRMEDGSQAVGLFNRGEGPTTVTVRWSDLKLKGSHRVRDLWRQKDLGKFKNEYSTTVPRRGAALVRVY
ncbi:MAG TPA: NPCBM/NEW2 domain-containing protein [Verrucomicrobiae bacterium]